MTTTAHPEVVAYLRAFDGAASRLPRERRQSLRTQVEEHFLDAIPPGADAATVQRVIAQFGSPEEIVAGELADTLAEEPNPRRRRAWVIAIVVVAALALAFGALPFIYLLGFFGSTPRDAEPLPGDSRANLVVEHPVGVPRVTDGRAAAEYELARDTVGPLPEGASWPIGVPDGLDIGRHDEVVMEAGMGANVAQFTYLCAWEDEYLLAEEVGDDLRLTRSLNALQDFAESDFVTSASPDGGWYRNVVEPLTYGGSSGALAADRTQSCAGAGITVPDADH